MVKEEKKEKKKRRHLLPYLILIIGVIIIYSKYIEPNNIKVKDYSITNASVPESFDGFSIVQFSDLKIGSSFDVDDLNDLVKKINKLDPDLVIFTGDLISPDKKITTKEKEKIIKYLSKIDPLIGKYSIKGDEDYKNNNYNSIMSYSGFTDLTNKNELIYYKGLTPIVIYGLGSLNKKDQDFDSTFSYPSKDEDTKYMATYRILLAHEPDTIDKIKNYNIQLMLSGHSLNSSVNIPILKNNYNIKGASKYYDEKYTVNKTKLYISSGIGTNKYKMRFLSNPSISIFRLYRN